MKISRSSWHYRMNKKLCSLTGDNYYPSKTLCSYFWGTVVRLLSVPVVVLISVGLVYLIGLWLSSFIYAIIFGLWSDGAFLGTLFVTGIFVIVLLILWPGSQMVETYRDQKRELNYGNEITGFWALFFAFKNKVCPLIEYK